jgi:hypothetical protein
MQHWGNAAFLRPLCRYEGKTENNYTALNVLSGSFTRKAYSEPKNRPLWSSRKKKITFMYMNCKSCDSSFGIALGYGLDDWGSRVDSQWGLWIYLFTTVSRTALGPTQPPIQWVPGAFSLGVKWLLCEADHSPSSSAKVKNAWHYTSTPPVHIHGVVLS